LFAVKAFLAQAKEDFNQKWETPSQVRAQPVTLLGYGTYSCGTILGYQLLQESCILIFDKTDPVTLDLRTTALSKHNRLLAHEAQPKVAYKMLVFLIFSSPGFC